MPTRWNARWNAGTLHAALWSVREATRIPRAASRPATSPGSIVISAHGPCADITMLPGEVAGRLAARGIRVASLTDHNAACNVPAFQRVFQQRGILLVPGIEATTAEEVHLLCYFETMDVLWKFGRRLLTSYPHIANDPERFGYQLVCNERDEFVGQFPFLLSVASL